MHSLPLSLPVLLLQDWQPQSDPGCSSRSSGVDGNAAACKAKSLKAATASLSLPLYLSAVHLFYKHKICSWASLGVQMHAHTTPQHALILEGDLPQSLTGVNPMVQHISARKTTHYREALGHLRLF